MECLEEREETRGRQRAAWLGLGLELGLGLGLGFGLGFARLHLGAAFWALCSTQTNVTFIGARQQRPRPHPPCWAVHHRGAAHGAEGAILAREGDNGPHTARIPSRAPPRTRWVRLRSKRVTDNPSRARKGKVAEVLARLKVVDAATVLDEGVAA